MPVYNVEKYVAESIQSVLDQTYSDFELNIVNDGSTDNTANVVRSFQDARIRLITQENKGVSVARNKGIEAALGDYIAFLDGDDLWCPDCLAKMIAKRLKLKRTWYIAATSLYLKRPRKHHEQPYPEGTFARFPA
jgi:glycosyltransferase involved in cell wall biosynthesis